jgi:hypothetical protein
MVNAPPAKADAASTTEMAHHAQPRKRCPRVKRICQLAETFWQMTGWQGNSACFYRQTAKAAKHG